MAEKNAEPVLWQDTAFESKREGLASLQLIVATLGGAIIAFFIINALVSFPNNWPWYLAILLLDALAVMVAWKGRGTEPTTVSSKGLNLLEVGINGGRVNNAFLKWERIEKIDLADALDPLYFNPMQVERLLNATIICVRGKGFAMRWYGHVSDLRGFLESVNKIHPEKLSEELLSNRQA